MYSRDIEGIRGPDDRTDVEIMLPVLDSDMERRTTFVEIGDDLRYLPISIAINDISTIAVFE
jgi:hypothetical protein